MARPAPGRPIGFHGLANGSTATAGGRRDALRRAREQGFIE